MLPKVVSIADSNLDVLPRATLSQTR